MIKRNPKTSWAESYMPIIDDAAYIDETAVVIGNVKIGRNVVVLPNVVIRADEGMPIEIGENTNIQDGVVIHCLKNASVKIGRNVSIAHRAVIHGPTEIGDNTFIGFNTVILKAKIGKNCFISHNAVVINVEIPDGKFVPPLSLIDSEEKVEDLRDVTEAEKEFARDVIEVNQELRRGYRGMTSG